MPACGCVPAKTSMWNMHAYFAHRPLDEHYAHANKF